MQRQEDVQRKTNDWISALSDRIRGDKDKTIREQKLSFAALQKIKALSRHHESLSAQQKKQINQKILSWISKPPSVEYHRACVELLLHVGDASAQKKAKKHIQKQISAPTWKNREDLNYLRNFTVRKPADPMDLYWVYLIGSSEQRSAICEALWGMTFSHPWLRLLRSFVGLVESGHGAQLYAPLVYRSFETRNHQSLPNGEAFG